MANYEVDPSLLASRVPAGTELDLYDGKCFVSLVGFMFLDTRVLGVPIPWHVNFPEVNLRFYVKRQVNGETRRGVVFIREIVPRGAIAFVARTLYGEPYVATNMRCSTDEHHVRYILTRPPYHKGFDYLTVKIGAPLGVPERGSLPEFIIEHYWGYTRRGAFRTDEYRVEHPPWELYGLWSPKVRVSFGTWYGPEFQHLHKAEPHSVLLAEGSEIAVYKGKRIVA